MNRSYINKVSLSLLLVLWLAFTVFAKGQNINGSGLKSGMLTGGIIQKENGKNQNSKSRDTKGKSKQNIKSPEKLNQVIFGNIRQDNRISNTVIYKSLLVALLLITIYYFFTQRIEIRTLQQRYTLLKKENASLKKLLTDRDLQLLEKEWLVKEIHHRVKNNLQIVISLLNSQSDHLQENDPALGAIRQTQQRMQSISLIHQKLYQSERPELIDMPGYIEDLVSDLRNGFSSFNNLNFTLNLIPLELEISQAVSIGLILNEAITNAVKYASRDNRCAEISIRFQQLSNDQLAFEIVDNGPGFPPDFEIKECKTLGINLIAGLSRQLNGDFYISRQNRKTELKVTFLKSQYNWQNHYILGNLQEARNCP